MGETGNKLMGKGKKAVGRATGDRSLERRGKVQETTGKAQGGVRKAAKSVDRGLDKASRKIGEMEARRNAKRPKTTTRKTTTTTPRRRTTMERTTVEEDV